MLFTIGRQPQPIARGEMHVRFLARINAALQQLSAFNCARFHAKLPSDLSQRKRLTIGQARIERKLQTGNIDHADSRSRADAAIRQA